MEDLKSVIESPIFTETNLGTRLALPISPYATARDFKRAFERAHLICFPKHGEIKANNVMVHRKSFFYHLSDTLPLKCAFQSIKGNWFLQVNVCHSSVPDQLSSPEHVRQKINNHSNDGNDGAPSTEPKNFLTSTIKKKSKCWRRRRRTKWFPSVRISLLDIRRRFYFFQGQKSKKRRVNKKYGIDGQHIVSDKVVLRAKDKSNKEENSGPAMESHYESSESMSVSGIINKYFSYYDFSCHDEVNSSPGFSYSTVRGEQREKLMVRTDDCRMNFDVCTPPFRAKIAPENVPLTNESASMASSKVKEAKVGKRLLSAAKNLGIIESNKNPRLSLIRSLVYDITDEDE